MQVDFCKQLLDLDELPVKHPDGKELTYKEAGIQALLVSLESDRGEDGGKILERYDLAKKLKSSTGVIEISPEEAVLLKHRVQKAYGALIYGRFHEALK